MKKLPFLSLLTALTTVSCIAACSANPGPPPVEDNPPTSATTTPQVEQKKHKGGYIGIGIDPLARGLNPHLAADDHAFVQTLAALVLPSAFVPGEQTTTDQASELQLNTDLLDSATEIEAASGAAQTLRYELRREAQWSDGTPITGADFRFLWAGMVSTPGVINPAPYHAISQIRVSNGGKTVDVDLANRLDNWQVLFNHLLPSHMFNTGATTFEQALKDSVPASAGRYMVREIDRQRGVVTLTRNDRFWGQSPAVTETLEFREVRNPTHGAELLRNGQISVADLTPTETSVESLDLLPQTQVRTRDRATQLEVNMSVASRRLSTPEARAALSTLIDVPRIARLATGRSTDLSIAPSAAASDEEKTAARELLTQIVAEQGALSLATDGTDDTAAAAMITLADLLRAEGIEVNTMLGDMTELAGTQLPEGEVDALISWNRAGTDPQVLASRFACPQPAVNVTTSGSIERPTDDEEATPMLAGNLSGLCLPEVDAKIADMLAGNGSEAENALFFSDLENREHLRIPLLLDRRVDVLGTDIEGPASELSQWPVADQAGVLITAPRWKDLGNQQPEEE